MPFITSPHAIENYLKNKQMAYCLFFTKECQRTNKLIQLARKYDVPIKKVGKEKLKKWGAFHCSLEIPAEQFKGGQNWFKEQVEALNNKDQVTIVILDRITDPHNLGAILRSCALFGVDLVLYPQRRAAKGDTATVQRISTGATNIVQHGEIANIHQSLEVLKKSGCWIYGTDMKGNALHQQISLPRKTAFIIGSEGHGLSTLLRKSCDEILSISTTQKIDSLNASVACGIVLHHRYTTLYKS